MALPGSQASGFLVEQFSSLDTHRKLGVNLIVALSQVLGRSLPSSAFWEQLAHYAAALTGMSYAQILTYDPKHVFSSKAIYGPPSKGNKEYTDVNLARRFLETAQRRGTVLSLERGDSGIAPACAQALGLDKAVRVWLIPLHVGQEFVGILNLGESRLAKSKESGVDGLEHLALMAAVADMIGITIFRGRYHANIEEIYLDVLIEFSNGIYGNRISMEQHAGRTSELAKNIAGKLGYSESQTAGLRWAGLLHDIGKIGIPEEILSKPGPLTPYEWFLVKQHPGLGAELLKPVSSLADVTPMVRAHHERFDGTGYPDGLKGSAIPLGARILAVADTYTCLTDGRPYRLPCQPEEAVNELVRCQGSQFDPVVLQAFLALSDQERC